MIDTEEIVIQEIRARKAIGLKKYGVSLANNPLDEDAWMQHLKEELEDAVLYITRWQQERAKRRDDGK